MKFYIKENGSWVEHNILVAPQLIETFDESLDNFSCIIKLTNVDTPFEPDTLCKLQLTDKTLLFIVATDEVQLISRSSQYYQHNLTLVQNTRLLSKHLVRNSVFSQPARRYERAMYGYYCDGFGDKANIRASLFNVALDRKRKLEKSQTFKVIINPYVLFNSNYKYNYTSLSQFEYTTDGGATWYSLAEETVHIDITLTLYSGEKKYQFVSVLAKNVIFGQPIYVDLTTSDSNIQSISFEISFGNNLIIRPIVYNEQYYMSCNLLATLEVKTYYFTMYDIIQTLKKQTKTDLFTVVSNSELGLLLKDTIAPNLTFTSSTLFDCLTEIFRFYDATFTIDEEGFLGIEYLNQNRNAITKDFTNKSLTIKEDEYNRGLVNVFENALIEQEELCIPKNTTLGVVEESNWVLELSHNIQEILSFEFLLPAHSIQGGDTTDTYIDLTNYIVEQELYSQLPQYIDNKQNITTIRTQYNCFGYSGNRISIGGSFKKWGWGKDEKALDWFYGNWVKLAYYGSNTVSTALSSIEYSEVKVRIKYLSRTNGRLRIENDMTRYKGEMLVNQSQGYVDTNKLGLNILGLSLKLGNPTLSLTQKICSWQDRIIKGDIYTYQNANWLANSVRYTFYNDFIQVSVDFVKNYNALSQRVQVNREKRLSNISNELTIKAEENILEYVYVSRYNDTSEDLYIDRTYLYSFIAAAFGYNYSYSTNIDFACIDTYYESGELIVNNIYMPLLKYAAGNTLCLEMSYNSPISAGNSTSFGTANSGYSQSVFYTDDSGWADKIKFKLCSFTDKSFTYTHPKINNDEKQEICSFDYDFYKRPNEILSLNYQLVFLPFDKEVIIGNALITENGLLKNLQNKKLYIYYSYDEKYSVFDTKVVGNKVEITEHNIGVETSSNSLYISLTGNGTWDYTKLKSYAIGDELGNLYIGFNSLFVLSPQIQVRFYFITKHNRL